MKLLRGAPPARLMRRYDDQAAVFSATPDTVKQECRIEVTRNQSVPLSVSLVRRDTS